MSYIWCLGGVLFSLVADVLLKKSIGVDRLFWGGLLLYVLAAIPTAFALRTMQLGKITIVWEVMILILGLLTARFYFSEPITLRRIVAFGFIGIAIYLIG